MASTHLKDPVKVPTPLGRQGCGHPPLPRQGCGHPPLPRCPCPLVCISYFGSWGWATIYSRTGASGNSYTYHLRTPLADGTSGPYHPRVYPS